MPINEILAPSYLRVNYDSGIAVHSNVLYFTSSFSTSVVAGETVYNHVGVGGVEIPFKDIVQNVYNRMASEEVGVDSITKIELWQANVGANSFVAEIEQPVITPSATLRVASSYAMWVYKSLSRQQYRITGFEYSSASPQRFAGFQPTVAPQPTLAWYMLKSNVLFGTQDGERLATLSSINSGYNRKLARSYGRQIAP